jgi:hypothetical protein
MPGIVEIDESELLRLRRLGDTVGAMTRSPSAKRKLLEALKDVRPDDPSVKELEKPDPIESGFEELRKANSDLRKQIEDDKSERERNTKLDAIKHQQDADFDALRRDKWTPDGIAKVKEVMEREGILNVRIAADHIEKQMPPASDPIMPGGHGGWNFADALAGETDADLKRLIESKGENEGLLRKMAGEAINEVRGSTGARR